MKYEDNWQSYLENQFKKHSNRIFVVDINQIQLNYGDLARLSQHFAEELDKHFPKGPIALMGMNTISYYVVVLAILKNSRPLFVFQSDWHREQILSNLEELQITNVLYDQNLVGKMPFLKEKEITSLYFGSYVFQKEVGIRLDSESESLMSHLPKINLDYSPGIYLSTSGSTGQSKWVKHTLGSVITNMEALAATLDLTDSDRIHSVLPLFTSNGMTITFFLPFSKGASIFLDQRFQPFSVANYFPNAIKYQVTVLSLVPSIVSILNQVISAKSLNNLDLSRIRFGICGTAPLRTEDRKNFLEKFTIPLYVNYGLTETLFVTSQNEKHCTSNSSGTLLEGVSLQFKDGEIGVSSKSVMEGYVNSPKTGTVFYTGDLGIYKEGQLYIQGRKKDLIIKGGFKINPGDLDEYLSHLNGVIESYSFGVENSISGENLYSAIVLKNVDDEILIKQIREKLIKDLPNYMIPKLLIVETIPKNATGKPIKEKIIEKYALRK